MHKVMPTRQKKYRWCLYPLLLLWLFLAFESSARPLLQVGIGYSDQIHPGTQNRSYTFEVLFTYRLLTELGYDVQFVTAPYARLTGLLQQQKLHIATRQSGLATEGLFYSSPYTSFDNQVFALADSKARLANISALKPYNIVAFQNASKVLGPEFASISQQAKSYQELLDHTQAIQMLLKKRSDLLVMDKNTFYRRLAELKQSQTPIISFAILPKVQYRLGFYQPQLQQRVERLLQQWLASGQLDRLRTEAAQSAPAIEQLLRTH